VGKISLHLIARALFSKQNKFIWHLLTLRLYIAGLMNVYYCRIMVFSLMTSIIRSKHSNASVEARAAETRKDGINLLIKVNF
jgi:hypothetical protein